MAGHVAPPELDCAVDLVEQFRRELAVLLIGDVVRLGGRQPVRDGERKQVGEPPVIVRCGPSARITYSAATSSPWPAGRCVAAIPEVCLDAGDADADAVVCARVRRPLTKPVVEPRSMEGNAEPSRWTDTGLGSVISVDGPRTSPRRVRQHHVFGELRPRDIA